ncbi:hypothetical protein ACOKA8_004480, partial [Citrobacter freundii]
QVSIGFFEIESAALTDGTMMPDRGPLGKRKISYVKPVSLAGITKSERLYGTDRRPNTIKMRRKKQVT